MQWIISGIEILRSRRSLTVVAGMKKKRMTTQNRQRSNAKKYKIKKIIEIPIHTLFQTSVDSWYKLFTYLALL